MPSGRPRLPGTEAERAAARRQQVRENVRAFRQRNRERRPTSQTSASDTSPDTSRRSSSTGFESTAGPTTESQFAFSQSSNQERHQITLRSIPYGTRYIKLFIPSWDISLQPVLGDVVRACSEFRAPQICVSSLSPKASSP